MLLIALSFYYSIEYDELAQWMSKVVKLYGFKLHGFECPCLYGADPKGPRRRRLGKAGKIVNSKWLNFLKKGCGFVLASYKDKLLSTWTRRTLYIIEFSAKFMTYIICWHKGQNWYQQSNTVTGSHGNEVKTEKQWARNSLWILILLS